MSSEATRSEFVVGVDGSVASYAAVSRAAHEATLRGLPIKERPTCRARKSGPRRRLT